jgi:hypothetical protein
MMDKYKTETHFFFATPSPSGWRCACCAMAEKGRKGGASPVQHRRRRQLGQAQQWVSRWVLDDSKAMTARHSLEQSSGMEASPTRKRATELGGERDDTGHRLGRWTVGGGRHRRTPRQAQQWGRHTWWLVAAASDGELLCAGWDRVPGSGRVEQRRPGLVDGAVEESSEELRGGDEEWRLHQASLGASLQAKTRAQSLIYGWAWMRERGRVGAWGMASGAQSMGEGGRAAGGARPCAVGRRDRGPSAAAVGHRDRGRMREKTLMRGTPVQHQRALYWFKYFKRIRINFE